MTRQHCSAVIALLLAAAPAAAQQPVVAAPANAIPSAPVSPSGCDADDDTEIVVCGRSDDARYRLPSADGFDPRGLVDSVSRERHRLLDVGAAGIHSCSAVGPGGWTGCDLRRWREGQEQRAGISQEQPRAVTFGPVSVGAIRH